jgi:hypothetical protein
LSFLINTSNCTEQSKKEEKIARREEVKEKGAG